MILKENGYLFMQVILINKILPVYGHIFHFRIKY